MDIKINNASSELSIVIPEGEIDMGSSGELRQVLQKIIKNKTNVIIISLEDASYIDSSGIATIIEALKKIEKYNGKLRLVINTNKIWNVFKLARLDMVFKIYESIEEAKNA